MQSYTWSVVTSIFVIGAPRRRRIASLSCLGLYDSLAMVYSSNNRIYSKKGPKPFYYGAGFKVTKSDNSTHALSTRTYGSPSATGATGGRLANSVSSAVILPSAAVKRVPKSATLSDSTLTAAKPVSRVPTLPSTVPKRVLIPATLSDSTLTAAKPVSKVVILPSAVVTRVAKGAILAVSNLISAISPSLAATRPVKVTISPLFLVISALIGINCDSIELTSKAKAVTSESVVSVLDSSAVIFPLTVTSLDSSAVKRLSCSRSLAFIVTISALISPTEVFNAPVRVSREEIEVSLPSTLEVKAATLPSVTTKSSLTDSISVETLGTSVHVALRRA
ncbi:hypothetical protein [Enterobacteria phage vB_EcoM_IME540]|nr:hypothetical protein [Enterobacteria phage vB_EcoM_IME540]